MAGVEFTRADSRAEAFAKVAWLCHKQAETLVGSREWHVFQIMLDWWEDELARVTGQTAQIIPFPRAGRA